MTCPHLEQTSAWFDREVDPTHECDECRAFLADAAQLRKVLHVVTDFSPSRLPESRRPEGRRHIFAGAFVLVLCLVLFLVLRPQKVEDRSPFAGLDGGGRAVITVRE